MHRLGTWGGHNYYNQATYNAVKNFQRNHNLPATGNVNLKTWQKLGFSKSSWYGIDNYVAPLGAQAWQGRSVHIEAVIKQAYKYMGNPWLAGCSSSPAYGVDCSALLCRVYMLVELALFRPVQLVMHIQVTNGIHVIFGQTHI